MIEMDVRVLHPGVADYLRKNSAGEWNADGGGANPPQRTESTIGGKIENAGAIVNAEKFSTALF